METTEESNQHCEKTGISKEKTLSVELKLPLKLLNQLNQETIKKFQDNSGEFWVIILESPDGNTVSIPVGIGHSSGVSANPNAIVTQLKFLVEQGYVVVADYHNHPNKSIFVYKEVGLPEVFATSPSTADLYLDENSVMQKLVSELHQEPYPRIIAAYSQDRKKVLLNTFIILREPTDAEIKLMEFDEPNFIEQNPDEIGIRLLASKFVDPSKLNKLGIISLKKIIAITEEGNIIKIPNDLENALSVFNASQ